ncbi:MAG: hypothetical protein J6A79_10125 [Clostridia bacterium]|nr:hypothetical protein [Clostridia bacterium]
MPRKYYQLSIGHVGDGGKLSSKYYEAIDKPIVIGSHEEHYTEGVIFKKHKSVTVKDTIKIPCYYLYEENGKLYEFFTGQYFGTIMQGHYYIHTVNNVVREPWDYVMTKLCYDYGTLDYYSHELSATQFADGVKKYESYKETVATTIREYLAVLDECIRELILTNNANAERKENEEKAAASWLDAVIQGRTD